MAAWACGTGVSTATPEVQLAAASQSQSGAPPAPVDLHACDQLKFGTAGDGRLYDVLPPAGSRVWCDPGTSDAAGTMAVVVQMEKDYLYKRQAFFFDTSGATLSTREGHWLTVAPKKRGFFVAEYELDGQGRGFGLWALDGKGLLQATLFNDINVLGTLISGSSGRVEALTSSGAMGSLGTLSSFDAEGRSTFTTATAEGCHWLDSLGNTIGPEGWMDTQGKMVSRANIFAGPTPARSATSFEPRIGGGFFVHVTDVDLKVSRWVAQIDSLARDSTPAPAFLAKRPETRLRIIKGGAGYALLPLAGACSQTVEILTANGQSCGFVSFPDIAGACSTSSLDVGLDGTVIQALPASSGCGWRYWPAFFQ